MLIQTMSSYLDEDFAYPHFVWLFLCESYLYKTMVGYLDVKLAFSLVSVAIWVWNFFISCYVLLFAFLKMSGYFDVELIYPDLSSYLDVVLVYLLLSS